MDVKDFFKITKTKIFLFLFILIVSPIVIFFTTFGCGFSFTGAGSSNLLCVLGKVVLMITHPLLFLLPPLSIKIGALSYIILLILDILYVFLFTCIIYFFYKKYEQQIINMIPLSALVREKRYARCFWIVEIVNLILIILFIILFYLSVLRILLLNIPLGYFLYASIALFIPSLVFLILSKNEEKSIFYRISQIFVILIHLCIVLVSVYAPILVIG